MFSRSELGRSGLEYDVKMRLGTNRVDVLDDVPREGPSRRWPQIQN